MKKRYIVLIIALVVAIAAVWYLAPSHFLNVVNTDDVEYITVFNGGNGGNYKITNKTAIEHIVNNVQKISFKKNGISLGRKGYRFRLTFHGNSDKVIEKFIINESDTIRKDPFFYYDKTSSLDVDYIEKLLTPEIIIKGTNNQEYNPNEEQSFVGKVIEETTTYIIVEPANDEYERTVADKIKIEYGTDHLDYLYGTGRLVVIYYKGEINTDDGKMSSIKTDDISTEGFREFSLHVVRTEGATEVGAEIQYGPPKAVLSSNDTQGFTSFGHFSDTNLYYYGLNNVYISVDDKDLPLKEALEKGKITLDGIIAKCNRDVTNGIIEENSYDDGGSQVYEYPEYTIIKYHTLDGNRDVYIGVPGMDINVKDK